MLRKETTDVFDKHISGADKGKMHKEKSENFPLMTNENNNSVRLFI